MNEVISLLPQKNQFLKYQIEAKIRICRATTKEIQIKYGIDYMQPLRNLIQMERRYFVIIQYIA